MVDYKEKYNMNYYNAIYKDIQSISDSMAIAHSGWVNPNDKKALYKIKKEMLSENLMYDRNVWKTLFSSRMPRVANTKESQIAGIDYVIYDNFSEKHVAVDLKASFGDYRKDDKEQLAIEYKQNGIVSFSKDKKTEYVVYVYGNTNTEQLYFVRIPYFVMLELVANIKDSDCQKSDNGSGLYFRVPIEELENVWHCMVLSMPYKKDAFLNFKFA